MADQVLIRETLSITHANVTDEDKALGAEFNRIAWMALAEAERMLKRGRDTDRAMVVRIMLSSISKLSTLESKTQIDESRSALFEVLDKISHVQEVRPVVTASEILDAVTIEAVAGRSNNQDDVE